MNTHIRRELFTTLQALKSCDIHELDKIKRLIAQIERLRKESRQVEADAQPGAVARRVKATWKMARSF